MKFTSVSIAVLSEGNNPLLLSPDFLGRNGITPETWEPKPDGVLVLPPFARVLYTSGVEFVLQTDKLLIRAHDPSGKDWTAELPRMTIAFLATLPHVAYGAVGLNFEMRKPAPGSGGNDQPGLLDAIVTEGRWREFGGACDVQGVKFRYKLADAVLLNLTVEIVQETDNDNTTEQFRFDANFHHDFKSGQDNERRAYINTLCTRHEQIMELLERFSGAQS